jgi:5-carboxymethyl-2-hydroxymuconate isomerase
MAHATVEWTDNLEAVRPARPAVADRGGDARRSGGVFPVGGIRVRAIRLHDYVIADGAGADDAFINIDIKMGLAATPRSNRPSSPRCSTR